MKTTILRAVLPILAVAIASLSALAFSDANDSSAEDGELALFTGWHRVSNSPQVCEESEITCSEIDTNPVCMDASSRILFKKANPGVTCPQQLYRQ